VCDAVAAGAPLPLTRQPHEQLVAGRPRRCRRHANPAGVVAAPGHARGELVGAVAGEHQVRVAVDESGHHGAATRVDVAVADGLAGVCQLGHEPALEDQCGARADAEHAVAQLGVAGDELADVVDDESGHRSTRSSSAGTSTRRCAPSRTTQRPPIIT
jgi:hypothetical protein